MVDPRADARPGDAADADVRRPRVGVLALQGNVREHMHALEAVGAEPVAVKRPPQLEGLDGLVIPGGESPTMIKLLRTSGLEAPLRERVRSRAFPLFGTCAGLILLSRETGDPDVPGFRALDVEVRRNAYGRQRESFEIRLPDHVFGGEPLEAVFIRAPAIGDAGPDVRVLARHEGRPVAVRQGDVFGAAFHPELTTDHRLYAAFVEAVRQRVEGRSGSDAPSTRGDAA